MTKPTHQAPGGIPRSALYAAAGIAGLVGLLLYLQGAFRSDRVSPGESALADMASTSTARFKVEEREVDDWVDWPATVTSRAVANLAPKVMARVLEVRVAPGQRVRTGDVLVVLDDRDTRARLQQAEAAMQAADALATQATADLRRARRLFEQQATTQQDLDAAIARAASAQAQVAQARDAVAEARVMTGETELRAPFDGVVATRLADPGNLAVPGNPIVVVHDPSALRLEANIAEKCARSLTTGTELVARVGSADGVAARVEEIAPAADPSSRTVLIKASLPAAASAYPGMFANLRVVCGRSRVIAVPLNAVHRAGQLESVTVLVDGMARRRNVRTGKIYDDQVEVLSGLAGGETILLEE